MSTLALTNLHIVADLVREGISRSISRWGTTCGDVVAAHGHPWVWVDWLSRHTGQVEIHGSCTALKENTLLEVLVCYGIINIRNINIQLWKGMGILMSNLHFVAIKPFHSYITYTSYAFFSSLV